MKKSELKTLIKETLEEARKSTGDSALDYYAYKRENATANSEKVNKAIPLLLQVVRSQKAAQIITAAEAKNLENIIYNLEKKLG